MARILFVTSRFPYPLEKGDKLRAYFQIKSLSRHHEVHLVALNETGVTEEQRAALAPHCASMAVHVLSRTRQAWQLLTGLWRGIPLQVALFLDARARREVAALAARIRPDVVHAHLIRTAELVRNIPDVRKSLDLMDAFGLGMEKRAAQERNPLKRMLFRLEKSLLYRYEAQIVDSMDALAIISEQDRVAIPSPHKDRIVIIPNGVDFDAFRPRDIGKRYELVFMGNLAYPPNIVAATFLVNQVMPLVWAKDASVKLLIAGIDPPHQLRQTQSGRVDVVAEWADIAEAIACARIMVAPMQISIGLQNKILQAMAMKVPCVVSHGSNQAVGAPAPTAVRVADTPAAYAHEILDLLSHPATAAAMAEEAHAFVHARYDWDRQNERLAQLILP
jgi:glycosyltransferase involved in cell wall biosynthesis